MALNLPPVKPGDLIAAMDWNALVLEVVTLRADLTLLQTGVSTDGSVVITRVLPTGALRITTEVHVQGRNFGFTIGACRVFITRDATSVRVDGFKLGTNDQELIFNMPDIPGVLSAGSPARLSVSNASSTANADITLLPAQSTIGGSVDVTPLGVDPATFTAGSQADFKFRVKARTNIDGTFTLSPVVVVASNQAEWQNSLQVLDENKGVLAARTIKLNVNQEAIVFVRIPSVPATPANAPFTLTLSASSGDVKGSSGPAAFTVGIPADLPDEAILTFIPAGVEILPAGFGTRDQSGEEETLKLKIGGGALVTFLAEVNVAGTYGVSITPLAGTTNWTTTIDSDSTLPTFAIADADLANAAHKAARNPKFVVAPGAGASATGEIEYRLQRNGVTKSRVYRTKLEVQA
jgi:hypothetical protein